MIINFLKDCPNGNDEKVCADCDFENSTCQYKDISSGVNRWERIRGDSAQGTGPSIDHTFSNNSGHYMLVSRSGQGEQFTASFLELKQILKPSSSSCELEFYYFLQGNKDDITLFLNDGNNYYEYVILDSIYGDTNNLWRPHFVRLGRVYKPFSLEFVAYRNYGSDNKAIAIDDIKLKNCEFPHVNPNGCSSTEFTCARKACVPENYKCIFLNNKFLVN